MLLALVALAAGLLLLKLVVRTVYNVYFHPLRRFPGPFWHGASRLPWVFHLRRGRLPFHQHQLHARYGPVVRIAPDELTFVDPAAWRDIYALRSAKGGAGPGSMSQPPKDDLFYKASPRLPEHILNTNDEKHGLWRRTMAPSFSDGRMREQEPLIGRYITLLIQRLRELGSRGEAANLVNWYTWTTFDVIGDLSMGAPFGCLDGSDYHPWVSLIGRSILIGPKIVQPFRSLRWDWIIELILKFGMKARRQQLDYVSSFLNKRRAVEVDRPDLIDGFVKLEQNKEMSFEDLRSMASILVIAGSETTATLLCGVTFLLLRNPHALKKVTDEVRGAFNSEDEITLTSVNGLTYMLACLNEALRMYPPVTSGLPRKIPAGGGIVAGMAIPENTTVSIPMWAAHHHGENWTKPFEFHPERFMGDPEFASDKMESLQPFSIGPRNCVGRNLAYAEMRLILAQVLYNFDMKLADESQEWLATQKAYFLWAKQPLNVYLTSVRG